MTLYFNELDSYAAQWLRNLWPGATVDDRSIAAVQPSDLAGYRRVHLFAGIGGWEYALSLAGWPEAREVWTGSCPCQPFSGAGRNDGLLDSRHLWPAFHRLIAECRPATVFGEQVASKAGRAWLAGVRTDLEALGYAVGAADLCAASVGAPHIRQRLYWVAESTSGGRGTRLGHADARRNELHAQGRREALGLAHAGGERRQQERGGPSRDEATDGRAGRQRGESDGDHVAVGGGEARRLGDTTSGGRREQRDAPREGRSGHAECPGRPGSLAGGMVLPDEPGREPGQPAGSSVGYGHTPVAASGARFWDAYDLLPCRDGKARRVERGIFPLASGVPYEVAGRCANPQASRTGILRAAGNAIVPPLAAEFIRAYMDAQAVKDTVKRLRQGVMLL